MRYYPIYLDMRGRNALVVGGGAVGSRKAQTLLRAGARVTVVSPLIALPPKVADMISSPPQPPRRSSMVSPGSSRSSSSTAPTTTRSFTSIRLFDEKT